MRHGSKIDPPNRFERVRTEFESEHVEWDTEYLNQVSRRDIEYIENTSKSIVTENSSPDINFRYSINPYNGCVHACAYCYARPYHEYLGFNAGLDFETKIIVKKDAPQLFRNFLARPNWIPEQIVFSGITDCYQPIERKLKITRSCLQVAAEAQQPIGVITKNALVVRDIDLLAPMAEKQQARVCVSLTTLQPELAREMEPRTSIPQARLRAIQELSQAGIPTKVMLSPVIPGLNDHEIPEILAAARQAGATSASYVLLRLPLAVEDVFKEWLERTQPERKDKVLQRIRQCRQGRLNRSEFGSRMKGDGTLANQIEQMFRVFSRKHGLDQSLPPMDFDQFVPPVVDDGQMRLF